MDDYAADVELTTADPKAMTAVLTLARTQWKIENEIADLESHVRAKKEELRRISEVDLPEAMGVVGVTEQPLGDGYTVKLETSYFASIPKALAEQAFKWLDDNDHGSLIKHEVKILFGRGDSQWFQEFMDDLSRRNRPVDAKVREFVEPQTLGAFVRDQIRKGTYLPTDLLGIHPKRATTIVAPKRPTEL